MIRTTIFLPPALHDALRTLAFTNRTSIGEEIRRAVGAHLQQAKPQKAMPRETRQETR